jgi:hypothetical protein
MSIDYSIDWNTSAEKAVATGLGMVPTVGTVLSALTYILWPASSTDVWGQIKAQVEALINQKLDTLVYSQVQASLTGLHSNVSDFLTSLQTGTGVPTYISEKWNVANGDFQQQLATFQLSGYEVLLLPLFAQFANLHLSLLRDGALFGANWGWTPAITNSIASTLTTNIASYTAYAQKIYQQGYQSIVSSTKSSNHSCQPFRTVNSYVRQMTLGVLDYAQLWPYFDTIKYAKPVTVYLSREIYSDPVGTCDDSGAINLPSAPTQPISKIVVWGWDRIDAAQVYYPSGGGPGGVTQTARMGDKSGGSNTQHGGTFNVSSSNPVVTAKGHAGDILNSMTFLFQDGSSTGEVGGAHPGGNAFSFSYGSEILSSIHINGISKFYGSADSAVFGFKYQQGQTVSADTLQLLYIASPTPVTTSQLAANCVTTPVAAATLQTKSATDGWDAQRQMVQAQIKSSAQS